MPAVAGAIKHQPFGARWGSHKICPSWADVEGNFVHVGNHRFESPAAEGEEFEQRLSVCPQCEEQPPDSKP